MIRCSMIRSQLAASVAGDLSVAEHKRVQTHLAGCPSCRAKAEQDRAMLLDLRAAKTLSGPSLWDASFEARLDAVEAAGKMRRGRFQRWRLASAAALLLLVGGISLRFLQPSQPATPATAANSTLESPAGLHPSEEDWRSVESLWRRSGHPVRGGSDVELASGPPTREF